MSPSDTCACLALYGCEAQLDALEWLAIADRFFKFLQLTPTKCVVEDQQSKTKVLQWKNVQKAMAVNGRAARSIGCYVEKPFSRNLLEWLGVASWSKPLHDPRPNAFFGYRGDVGKFRIDDSVTVTRMVADSFGIGYGIGYERERKKGPEAYALGMPVGLGSSQNDEEVRRQLSAWWREFLAARDAEPKRFRHLAGMLRDIYPVSILSELHTRARVASQPLADWISASPRRGTLKTLSETNWIWLLHQDEVNEVRQALARNGLLIAMAV